MHLIPSDKCCINLPQVTYWLKSPQLQWTKYSVGWRCLDYSAACLPWLFWLVNRLKLLVWIKSWACEQANELWSSCPHLISSNNGNRRCELLSWKRCRRSPKDGSPRIVLCCGLVTSFWCREPHFIGSKMDGMIKIYRVYMVLFLVWRYGTDGQAVSKTQLKNREF